MFLIIRLLIGISSGIFVGLFAPDFIISLFLTAQNMLGQLINFIIPLIILFFISSGIASLPSGSSKLLSRTVVISYSSTIVAGFFAFFVASNIVPFLAVSSSQNEATNIGALTGFIDLKFPPLFGVMSALLLAFILGIGSTATKSKILKTTLEEGRDIIDIFLAKVLIPILPIYIAGVFANIAADGSVFSTLKTFSVVLVLAVSMHWVYMSALFLLTGLKMGKSPLKLLSNMLPAYFTALGTMSSAATIPVTLSQAKKNGVSSQIANFSIPLCASIHLAGSTITLTICSVAVMFLTSSSIPSWGEMIPFIMMLGVVMVAAPGAPGGAVMAALGVMTNMLGFSDAAIALMIALYMAQDSFGTACNITCDGALAMWVEDSLKENKEEQMQTQRA